jgi:hypothetical protein
VRDDSLDSVGVGGADDSFGGGLSSNLDAGHLVTDGGEDVGQKSNEVGLDGGGDLGVLGDSADSIKGALASDGILLAGKLLLQKLNSPGYLLVLAFYRATVSLHILGGSISLLNVTIDEGGDRGSGGVDLILSLGDGELAEKLLEDLDGLGVLARLSGGVVQCCRSHVVEV